MTKPGGVIAWWDGPMLRIGIVSGIDRQRWAVIGTDGKTQRVRPSRYALTIEGGGAPPSQADAEGARSRLRALGGTISAVAAEVDPPLLWELVREQDSSDKFHSVESLADLALGRVDGASQAAVIQALLEDAAHFQRKPDGWQPREPIAVDGILRQRAKEAERATQKEQFFASLQKTLQDGDPFERTENETELRYLDALEQLAVQKDETPGSIRKIAYEALEQANIDYQRDFEGAFKILHRVGHWKSKDENLLVEWLGIPPTFDEELLAAARRVATQAPAGDRVDLTDLETISVDSAQTTELDDLLSAEQIDNGVIRIGVHIADPGAWIQPEDRIDREALHRGVTHYFPDLKLLMLPAELSEGVASLQPGLRRPAISFLIDLARDGSPSNVEIKRSWVINRRRLTYEQMDRDVEAGNDPLLELLVEVGRRRLDYRGDGGAVYLGGEEFDVSVVDGEPQILGRDRDAPSQQAVSESMILCGEVGAAFLAEHDAPASFRWQPEPPDGWPEGAENRVRDPVEAFGLRRYLRRAEVSLRPKPHFSLGLGQYAQLTSPLRRFQDLVLQRQLTAILEGRDLPYDRPAMLRISAITEAAERRARRAEREACEYWMLRWLESRVGQTISAQVLAAEPRSWIRIDACGWERPLGSLPPGAQAGDRIELRVENVSPRAGLLYLQPVS